MKLLLALVLLAVPTLAGAQDYRASILYVAPEGVPGDSVTTAHPSVPADSLPLRAPGVPEVRQPDLVFPISVGVVGAVAGAPQALRSARAPTITMATFRRVRSSATWWARPCACRSESISATSGMAASPATLDCPSSGISRRLRSPRSEATRRDTPSAWPARSPSRSRTNARSGAGVSRSRPSGPERLPPRAAHGTVRA